MGELIDIVANGFAFKGYLATPKNGKAIGRGVLVIQEWWGLTKHIESIADRFAAEGYVALAPDLYRAGPAGARDPVPDDLDRAARLLDRRA